MTLDCHFLFLPPNKILRFLQIVQRLVPSSLDWIRCCDSLHLSKECPTQCFWCFKCGNSVFCIDHIVFPKCYIPTICFWFFKGIMCFKHKIYMSYVLISNLFLVSIWM
jgi:hypothetical protein